MKPISTRFYEISPGELELLSTGAKTFIICSPNKQANRGDTLIVQDGVNEATFTITATETGDEATGLKKGWQVLSLSNKEAAITRFGNAIKGVLAESVKQTYVYPAIQDATAPDTSDFDKHADNKVFEKEVKDGD